MRPPLTLPRLAAALAIAIATTALAAALAGSASAQYGGSNQQIANPCLTPMRAQLLCPDLRMGRPRDMYVTRRGGRVRLHARNDIRSRGLGPIEVVGHRNGPRSMRVVQRIRRRGGGRLAIRSPGSLRFYFIPGQGRYWKFHQAARFEIWSLRPDGTRARRLRVGPKLTYCLRDLRRTRRGRRSPKRRFYPACSQDPRRKRVRLGTSVGWSDIYPASYHENWINVRGLRGCFLFTHRADPMNHLAEANERNNAASIRIRLPPRRGRVLTCRGGTAGGGNPGGGY